MKNLLIFLTLLTGIAVSQESTRELKNLHNDKYMEKYNYQNNSKSVVCESTRGRRIHCPANTRYGVNFNQQLSYSTCNYNWGYDQTGIWVENGCRAEFTVNYGWDQPNADGNIMVCESHGYQKSYCDAYLDGREVLFLRQLSYTTCLNNWGYDRNGVWVTNGCRAEFIVKQNYNTQNDVVYCSSNDLKFNSCTVDVQGGVEFVRQLSRASCNENWGYDRQGIWVRNGCRAKFKILPRYTNNQTYQGTVNCSSRNLQRRNCQADTSDGVRLKNQLSRADCNGNWGYTKDHIWVDNGCRATFQLYINNNGRNNSNTNNHQGRNDNMNNYQEPYSNRVVCESINSSRKNCPIPLRSKVTLHNKLSRTSCAGNWGYTARNIWVMNGCRAEFNVK